MARTPRFQCGNTGSIPVGATKRDLVKTKSLFCFIIEKILGSIMYFVVSHIVDRSHFLRYVSILNIFINNMIKKIIYPFLIIATLVLLIIFFIFLKSTSPNSEPSYIGKTTKTYESVKFHQQTDERLLPPFANDPELKNLGYITNVVKKDDGIYIDFTPIKFVNFPTAQKEALDSGKCTQKSIDDHTCTATGYQIEYSEKRMMLKFAQVAKIYPSPTCFHSAENFKNLASDNSITAEDFIKIFKEEFTYTYEGKLHGSQPFDLMYDSNGNVSAAQEIFLNP